MPSPDSPVEWREKYHHQIDQMCDHRGSCVLCRHLVLLGGGWTGERGKEGGGGGKEGVRGEREGKRERREAWREGRGKGGRVRVKEGGGERKGDNCDLPI